MACKEIKQLLLDEKCLFWKYISTGRSYSSHFCDKKFKN